MLDMANDSGLFSNSPGQGMVPLYEAKMMYQYDHRFATYENATAANINEGNLPQLTSEMHMNPHMAVLPENWVLKENVEKRLKTKSDKKWLIAFRDVTSNASERTAIFSVLPRFGVGHTAPLVFLKNAEDVRLVLCFLACVNSLTFDYVARQKIGGAHLT